MSNIDAKREWLVAKIQPTNGDLPKTMRDMAGAIITLAEQEGLEDAQAGISHVISHESGGAKAAAEWCNMMMSNGAEDTYSGRTNDIQRAYHDGFRRECTDFLRNYLAGYGIERWL